MKAIAVFRPRRNDVAVMIGAGQAIESQCLPLDAARQLHTTLGRALKLADFRDDPIGDVL